ncbi:MAG: DNA adenine methylase [Candidatus Campbellbacteria bacterium]|nr:DNA adenine methylase [Candidatus Campbellbacteria bacterium]
MTNRTKIPQIKKTLFSQDIVENVDLESPFFNSHLITYIGNKRRLLPFLYKQFLEIRKKLGKEKLIILDGFAGSGSVSRLLKVFASDLYTNDFEGYTKTINKAYLANKTSLDLEKLETYIKWLNSEKLNFPKGYTGFIEKNYAPKNDHVIKHGERVFYTNKNAKIIDNMRRLIDEVPKKYQVFCLASLLVKASIHTNTSGVFKGFHKKNDIGHFGGRGENALERIKKEIVLDTPIFSDFESNVYVSREDINKFVKNPNLPEFDLVYYDPPYNQHPYGSNYFMLNIINEGKEDCEIQPGVSGIVKNWQRSAYNKRKEAELAMEELLTNTRAKIIVISYNNEGLIPIKKFKEILSEHGSWTLVEQDYNAYRGSRNLRNRNIKVQELLWILTKD